MLLHRDGEIFAIGQTRFFVAPIGENDRHNRIIVNIEVEGISSQAYLDTGGVYFICHPNIAAELEIDNNDALESLNLIFRERRIHGGLHKLSLNILAEDGEDIRIEVTAFVPDQNENHDWDGFDFSILGFQGCFENIKFAIDASQDPGMFYFGS